MAIGLPPTFTPPWSVLCFSFSAGVTSLDLCFSPLSRASFLPLLSVQIICPAAAPHPPLPRARHPPPSSFPSIPLSLRERGAHMTAGRRCGGKGGDGSSVGSVAVPPPAGVASPMAGEGMEGAVGALGAASVGGSAPHGWGGGGEGGGVATFSCAGCPDGSHAGHARGREGGQRR